MRGAYYGRKKSSNIADSVTVGELAETLGLSVTTLIGELFKNGIAATINQRLDLRLHRLLVEELGLDVQLKRKTVLRNSSPCAQIIRQGSSSSTDCSCDGAC